MLSWGGFPLAGLVYVAAYRAAEAGRVHPAHGLFWLATAVGLLAAAGVVYWSADRSRAAAPVTAALAVLFSLPKFLRAPHYFNYYDELAHWRAVRDLLNGAALTDANPLNKVVVDYPGLAVVTATTTALTGGSIFAAGTAVVLAARVAGCLAVLLLAERVLAGRVPAGRVPAGRVPAERVLAEQLLPRTETALLAVAVFLANPAFMFFDAQFAYGSLACALVAVVLLFAVRLPDGGAALFVAALALAVLVVVTHHGSSYVLAGVLALAVVVALVRRQRPARLLLPLAGATAVAVFAWLFTGARRTPGYVGPYVRSTLSSIPDFLSGGSGPRRLLGGFPPTPVYEQVAAFVAVLVLFGAFCAGGWALYRRRGHDPTGNPTTITLALLGAGYFLSLPLVALRDDQVVKRLWEFTFIGLAPICAVGFALLVRRWRWAGAGLLAALLLVVFVGSGVARSGEHVRFPGPYRPSADPRSLTPNLVAAAEWMRRTHGNDNRVVGDRTLAAAFGSYGEQVPVTYRENGVPVWLIFTPETVDGVVLRELRRGRIGWVAVDRRTAGNSPLTGFYFDESEPGAYVDTRLTDAALAKFDRAPFRRVYDNGTIVLYQVRA
jgi:hypothetical protein